MVETRGGMIGTSNLVSGKDPDLVFFHDIIYWKRAIPDSFVKIVRGMAELGGKMREVAMMNPYLSGAKQLQDLADYGRRLIINNPNSRHPLAKLAKAYWGGYYKFKMKHLSNIEKVAMRKDKENWMASGWLLERQFPAEYGQRQNVEMNGVPKVEITNDLPKEHGTAPAEPKK